MNREVLANLILKKESTTLQNERWGGNTHLKKKKCKSLQETTFQTSMQKLKS